MHKWGGLEADLLSNTQYSVLGIGTPYSVLSTQYNYAPTSGRTDYILTCSPHRSGRLNLRNVLQTKLLNCLFPDFELLNLPGDGCREALHKLPITRRLEMGE